TYQDVLYVNDSLSTVPAAALEALKAFPDRHVVLLLGGYDRHLDFTEFCQALSHLPLRAIIAFPTTGEKILAGLRHFESTIPTFSANTMAEAVQHASTVAQPGDVVLLSPASPSFGLFKDYADRGNQFAREVEKLQK
ncbi:MAG: UDP-N-acetylmuramoyl-L-alanine--D-glutamate ligase, partial [bacterium]|nr:UDP-N-acetylmuramoyl-L-alanine--D-glutamate ligase [bacterium]